MTTHVLSAAIVRQLIPRKNVGFYRIGTMRGGKFTVRYFGRSDVDLRRRLLSHCHAKTGTHFEFRMTPYIYRAFVLECAEWHLAHPTAKNLNHPDAPRWIDYLCPYCAHAKSLAASHLAAATA